MSESIFVPYAVIAEACEQAADGSVTLTRIINRLECIEKSTPESHKRAPNVLSIKIPYAVCFNSAEPVTGLSTELRCIRPSGEEVVLGTKTFDLAGDYRGTFLSGTLDLVPSEDGWHVFTVVVGGIVKSRMVLHISMKRQTEKKRPLILEESQPNQPGSPARKCYAGG